MEVNMNDRIFHVERTFFQWSSVDSARGWYFEVRRGGAIGPYPSREHAASALAFYVNARIAASDTSGRRSEHVSAA